MHACRSTLEDPTSGLLHHFPSKDALIRALVERTVLGWRAEYEAAIEAQPPGPGRVPRAFLATCLSSTEKWTSSLRRRGVVLVAALVHDHRHVIPLQEVHRNLSNMIAADGLPPGVGEAVQLVTDGLWFDWIFGLTEMTPQKLAAVRTALRRLIEQGGAGEKPIRRVKVGRRRASRIRRRRMGVR